VYAGINFPPSTPEDDQYYWLWFINDLQSGELISSADVSFTLEQGVDPDPSSRLAGSYTIDPTQLIVGQRIRGLLAGNVYNLSIDANTTLGFTRNLSSRIICRAVY